MGGPSQEGFITRENHFCRAYPERGQSRINFFLYQFHVSLTAVVLSDNMDAREKAVKLCLRASLVRTNELAYSTYL